MVWPDGDMSVVICLLHLILHEAVEAEIGGEIMLFRGILTRAATMTEKLCMA